jgi:cysteine desulfurase/selenocysteine lyase
MTVEEARKQFPHTWTDMIYLNHAAISPLPFVVRDAADKYLERRALKGIEPHLWINPIMYSAKKSLSELLNTTPERIAFTLNTAEGVSILASGLTWQPGDRILLYRYEYPANVYPFLLQKKHGVEVDFMDPEDWRITLDVIKSHVTPRTKLISLSSVTSLTGFKPDLEEIGKYCKENNILFAVDAIQSLPHARIDVEKSNIDFIAAGAHKWLMGSEGTAFIYVSEKMQGLIQQTSMGAISVKNTFDMLFDFDTDRLRDDASRYENGTLNYPGIAGLNAVLKFHAEFGYDEMERRILNHTTYLISRLKTQGVNILTPEKESERSGIVSFEIEKPEDVLKRLEKKNIILAMRSGKLRLSPHFYNTEDELRTAVNAIFE